MHKSPIALGDLSKNRSKRFCESGCGNRAAVAAYLARKAAKS
ncbi:MAG: CGNR zinc finger domain-containing protein [Mycobacteriales bacterium]